MIRYEQVLTDAYVAGNILGAIDYNQCSIYVKYTKGDETDMRLKLDWSNDEATWYQQTVLTVSSGISTAIVGEYKFTATGNYRLQIPVMDKYMRVSVKATGGTPTGTVLVDSFIGRE